MAPSTKTVRDGAVGFFVAVASGVALMVATGAWSVFMGAWATKVTLGQHTADITAVRSEHSADIAAINAKVQRVLDAVCYDKPQVPVCKP